MAARRDVFGGAMGRYGTYFDSTGGVTTDFTHRGSAAGPPRCHGCDVEMSRDPTASGFDHGMSFANRLSLGGDDTSQASTATTP